MTGIFAQIRAADAGARANRDDGHTAFGMHCHVYIVCKDGQESSDIGVHCPFMDIRADNFPSPETACSGRGKLNNCFGGHIVASRLKVRIAGMFAGCYVIGRPTGRRNI